MTFIRKAQDLLHVQHLRIDLHGPVCACRQHANIGKQSHSVDGERESMIPLYFHQMTL